MLTTPRVALREFTEADDENLFELDGDPEVMRYLTGGVPSTREYVRGAIGRIEAMRVKYGGRFGFWAATLRESNAFMGWFHFRPAKNDPENLRRIELGYRMKRAFWGKGLATEVSMALIEKGFAELGVEEVFAVALKQNLASQRVMQKCGLKFVREYEDDDFLFMPGTLMEYAKPRP